VEYSEKSLLGQIYVLSPKKVLGKIKTISLSFARIVRDQIKHTYRILATHGAFAKRSGTVRVSFLLPAIIIITPGVAFLVIVSTPLHTHSKSRFWPTLIHKRLNHTTIYDVKSGDTYFLLYFCHMLLFKREKIVFYG
jgi:hypothetical protein